MRDHAGFDVALAVFVEVNAPWVARPFGEKFKYAASGMITPDAGIDARAFAVGRAGFADVRVREHAVATVKPAVRTPRKRVQRFMRVLICKAVEQRFNRTIGNVIVIAIGNKLQIWSCPNKHAAKADLHTAD